MVPHSWNFFFRKTLLKIFCAFILCQRERKRHWVVRKAWPCVLRFHVADHFILGGRHLWVSKYHSDCVRGEICFKEIVLNTRLDLNDSSFMHLVCEFLTICRFLLKYIQYLFIAFTYCKDQFRLRSNTGMDPGPRSPNNEFVECGKKS